MFWGCNGLLASLGKGGEMKIEDVLDYDEDHTILETPSCYCRVRHSCGEMDFGVKKTFDR